MIGLIAAHLARWLCQKQVIDQEDEELYSYAFISLVSTITPFILALIIGALMRKLVISMAIIIPFSILRKFSGGYHAKHIITCSIASVSSICLCVYIQTYLKCIWWEIIICAIASLSILVFSPIDSENYKLDKEEKIRMKKIVAAILLFMIMVYGILYVNRLITGAVCIELGIILTAILQLVAVVLKIADRGKEE